MSHKIGQRCPECVTDRAHLDEIKATVATFALRDERLSRTEPCSELNLRNVGGFANVAQHRPHGHIVARVNRLFHAAVLKLDGSDGKVQVGLGHHGLFATRLENKPMTNGIGDKDSHGTSPTPKQEPKPTKPKDGSKK